jgi:diaminopimelate epimerase
VVLIEPVTRDASGKADFRWRYFNADGSEGEMCGNGAMCGARFAIERGIAPNPCTFATMSGLVRAELDRESVMVWLAIPDTGPVRAGVTFEALGVPLTGHVVQVGVPHVVIPVDDADAWPPVGSFSTIGSAIRHHPVFQPAGTNVDIISPLAGGLRMRTYERGVEAETLACGTGAVASAVVTALLGRAKPPVRVLTSSGRTLTVDFALSGAAAREVRLGGLAIVTAKGTIEPDAWSDRTGDDTDHD